MLLADQDRALWHRDEIDEGRALAAAAAADAATALQAAIAAEHVARDRGHRLAPGSPSSTARSPRRRPVVELNRAVAVAMADGPERGPRADGHDRRASTPTTCCTPRARTCCAGWAGRDDARAAYERALELAGNPVEREFLERRLREA